MLENDFLEARSVLEKVGDGYAVADYLWQFAQLYESQGRLDKAIETAEESKQVSKKYQNKQSLMNASEKLSQLYEQKGEVKLALQNLELHNALRDSINNEEVTQRIADMRTEYEVGQKQTEVDLITAEKKTQEVILWAILAFAFVLVILAVIIYIFYRSKMRTNQNFGRAKTGTRKSE